MPTAYDYRCAASEVRDLLEQNDLADSLSLRATFVLACLENADNADGVLGGGA